MKLTTPQIQQLYTFTQKHYVDWYDVQTELVDHLANGIEFQLEGNPNLTFESALNTEFKKFGIMGFNDVIEEKTKALNKHYRLLVWKYFKDFFRLPKVILTFFLIWGYYNLLVFIEDRFWLLLITCFILLFFPIKFFYKQGKLIKFSKKETGKKWLFESTVIQLGGLSQIFNIGIYVSIILDLERRTLNTTTLIILSSFIVLFGLVLYISIYIVTPKLRKQMANQHPEYKFV
ncbi:hypothetical protein [Winogradskyella sp.]|uniref:hypothetical protein n=1 Tax=Winogradskyella sp. TaxID=1883156 RepID=UPI0025CC15B8|nr:hypothetical protein [Winogradskyella sp.]